MTATAAQSPTPPVNTLTGPLNTLLGWSQADPAVASVAPWYEANMGEISRQFVDRATLNARIAALPANAFKVTAINKEPDPLVMLTVQPLNVRFLVPGVIVTISGTGWASIDGKAWQISVGSIPLSQFRLLGADTTAEVPALAATATAAPARA